MFLRGLGLLAGAIALWELYLALGPRRVRRRRTYEDALRRSHELDKPLIVLGAPNTGAVNHALGPDYGCGDLCVDLVGCTGCRNTAEGPAEAILPQLDTDSAVIFVSCTLEYVDDVDLVWDELLRVSGGELFVVTVEPVSLTAWFYPGARRVLPMGTTPDRPLRYKALPWRSSGGVLPGAAAAG
jgi:hypothetical protein